MSSSPEKEIFKRTSAEVWLQTCAAQIGWE